MNALVRIERDDLVTDSQIVAEQFGKLHKDVLRAVTVLVKDKPDLERNFAPEIYSVPTGKGGQRQARMVVMDETGFLMLMMGFTGTKARDVQLRFVREFQRMRALLHGKHEAHNDDAQAEKLLPPLHEATRICGLAETYRRAYGAGPMRWIMHAYGLPVPPTELMRPGALTVATVADSIRQWLEQCTRPDPDGREEAMMLYKSYIEWCRAGGAVIENMTRFGRSLERLGYTKLKSGRVQRQGLVLVRGSVAGLLNDAGAIERAAI